MSDMTVIEERLIDFTLKSGAHPENDRHDWCLLEAVAWVAGEPWSDHPVCVDPVLAAFGRGWNDSLRTDEERTRLLTPFIPRLVGTRSTPAVQDRRAFMAADWAVRVFTPAWLRLAGLDEHATALSMLNELASVESCCAAMGTIRAARAAAARAAAGDAARDAAWDAAGDAAGDAARDAAGDAAWDAAGAAARAAAWDAAQAAAGDAAWDAAGDAAWDAAGAAARAAAGDAARAAARDAAGDAARDAAWDAARAAAWDAAQAAARDAAWDAAQAAAWDAAQAAARDAARAAARAAAGDAAGATLEPTVAELQASAVDLFDRMIRLTDAAA